MNKPIKIEMDKFPYLSMLKEKVSEVKQDITIYNARKPLLDAEIKRPELTPLEVNRLQEEINKLPRRLKRLHMDLLESENKFKKYNDHLLILIADANVNYDEVVDSAKKEMLKGNEKIKEQFEQYKAYDFNANWEAKINFFGVLKHLLSEEVKS